MKKESVGENSREEKSARRLSRGSLCHSSNRASRGRIKRGPPRRERTEGEFNEKSSGNRDKNAVYILSARRAGRAYIYTAYSVDGRGMLIKAFH